MKQRISIMVVIALAACTQAPRKGDRWPTLAPRPGEAMAVAPGCGGCGPGAPTPSSIIAHSAEPSPMPPAGADVRLTAIAAALKQIEEKLPSQAAATRRAVAAARDRGEYDDATVAAELQRTRLEALTLPLPDLQEQLDTLSAEVEGSDGTERIKAQIIILSARIAAAKAAGSL